MKIIYANILFFLFCFSFSSVAQTGSAGNPFTSLGQAQNISTPGIYYFNLTGTTFSANVLSGGWVQVAIDFGDGAGELPATNALTLSTRGILNSTILAKLTSANKARLKSSSGELDVQTSNATVMQRIVSNTCISHGTNDMSFNNSWTGTNTTATTLVANNGSANPACNITPTQTLAQTVHCATCAGNGFHWQPTQALQRIKHQNGEIPNAQYLELYVQAPFVAVVLGPNINTQPSNSIQNLCINGAATLLSVSASSPNPITYQWYSNASSSTTGGTAIAGETNASFLPPSNVAGTTYYYVICTDAVGPVTSTISGAVIVSNPTVAGTASTDQTICAGSTPTNLTLTGHTGTVQWQWSADNTTFTNISGATSATLTSGQMGALSATRYYRAIVTNGGCNAEISNTVTVTITPLPVITSTQGATNCGPGSLTLNATAASGTFSWYAALTGGVSLGNNASFITPSISANTTYYVDLTDNGCTSNPRVAVTATINSIPSPTITQSGCGSPRYLSTNPGGNALNLGNSNTTRYVTVPASLNASFNTNNATIEGWFNFTNSNTGNPMLIGEAYNGDNKITFCMYRNGANVTAGFFNGSFLPQFTKAILINIVINIDFVMLKRYFLTWKPYIR